MTHKFLYLDSSAILKFVVAEPESKALFKFLKDWPLRISSELARTEVLTMQPCSSRPLLELSTRFISQQRCLCAKNSRPW